MQVVYLHGFASSPQSSKAQFFADRLGARGIPVERPDLNLPDFSTLTVSRMIAQTEALIASLPPGPVAVIGSSLGAFIAWHVAARASADPSHAARLERLVLLAPALDFGAGGWRALRDGGLDRWRETGWHDFFHFAYGQPRAVHYALYDDARRYRSYSARVTIPTLVFQGTSDETVDPDMVIDFAASRPNVLLRLVDDGHQLLSHIETMWAETATFLGLSR